MQEDILFVPLVIRSGIQRRRLGGDILMPRKDLDKKIKDTYSEVMSKKAFDMYQSEGFPIDMFMEELDKAVSNSLETGRTARDIAVKVIIDSLGLKGGHEEDLLEPVAKLCDVSDSEELKWLELFIHHALISPERKKLELKMVEDMAHD